MPNNTTNKLSVIGPKNIVKAFINKVKTEETDLDLNVLIPTPSALLEGDGWYDWRVSNWGTKWNTYDSFDWDLNEIDENTTEAVLFYHSAWSPPSVWLEQIADMYDKLTFVNKAADEGGGFLISEMFSAGEGVVTEEFEWGSDEGIELREELGVYWPEDDE